MQHIKDLITSKQIRHVALLSSASLRLHPQDLRLFEAACSGLATPTVQLQILHTHHLHLHQPTPLRLQPIPPDRAAALDIPALRPPAATYKIF